MKELTLKDKQRIVAMLYKHYTIDPAAAVIIDIAADNAEQVTELTLKAFSMISKPKNDATPHSGKSTADDSNFVIVQIDEMSSKIQFIGAIRDVTCWNLDDCKIFADTIVHKLYVTKTCKYAYTFMPFKVGPGERITLEQWINIVGCNKDHDFKWHYEKEGE